MLLSLLCKGRFAPENLAEKFHSVNGDSPFVSRVVVSNPQAKKAIAHSKVKTDKVDARVISELLRIDYLPEVWMPDSKARELRALCARRASLVSDRVRLKNRIHGVLAANLVPEPKRGDLRSQGLNPALRFGSARALQAADPNRCKAPYAYRVRTCRTRCGS